MRIFEFSSSMSHLRKRKSAPNLVGKQQIPRHTFTSDHLEDVNVEEIEEDFINDYVDENDYDSEDDVCNEINETNETNETTETKEYDDAALMAEVGGEILHIGDNFETNENGM